MTLSDSHIEDSLYQISRVVHDSNNLNLLFKELHTIVRESISIDNFYVALMNRDLDLLTYPYYQDVKDNPPKEKFSKSKGVTHYVLTKEEKMIIDRSNMQKLINNGDLELIGTLPYYWLGVPLKDLILPLKIEVLTFVTLTLNIFSIALFISITLESLLTINEY